MLRLAILFAIIALITGSWLLRSERRLGESCQVLRLDLPGALRDHPGAGGAASGAQGGSSRQAKPLESALSFDELGRFLCRRGRETGLAVRADSRTVLGRYNPAPTGGGVPRPCDVPGRMSSL